MSLSFALSTAKPPEFFCYFPDVFITVHSIPTFTLPSQGHVPLLVGQCTPFLPLHPVYHNAPTSPAVKSCSL